MKIASLACAARPSALGTVRARDAALSQAVARYLCYLLFDAWPCPGFCAGVFAPLRRSAVVVPDSMLRWRSGRSVFSCASC